MVNCGASGKRRCDEGRGSLSSSEREGAALPQFPLGKAPQDWTSSGPHYPQGPSHPSKLTGHIEQDGSLHSHPISLLFHLTGEVGAVVPGPQGEV